MPIYKKITTYIILWVFVVIFFVKIFVQKNEVVYMTFEMIFVSIIILMMLVVLIFELARPEIVMFSVLVVLMITGVISADEAFKGFSNEGMLTVAFMFIVAGAVQKSGKVDLLLHVLKSNQSHYKTMTQLFVPVAAMSAFLNNTPIVATFTPIIKRWCEDHHIAPSKYLLPLSYVTILGGTITLIGTSTNLIVQGMLVEQGYQGFSFFTLGIVGVPITIVGLIYLFTIGYKLLPNHQTFSMQADEEAKEYLAELVVTKEFTHLNQSVTESNLRDLQGLYLIEIIRENERVSPVRPTELIQEGDRLIFTGLLSTLIELQQMTGLVLQTDATIRLEDLETSNIRLVEAVVSHQSSLLHQTIKEVHFRSTFDAGILAVHRWNKRVQSKIGDIILQPGDTLLLLAGSDFFEKYEKSNDFYVVTKLDHVEIEKNNQHSWWAIVILLIMISAVTMEWISMLEGSALATLLILAARLVTFSEAKKYMQFDVLFVIASSLGIGTAVSKSGLAEWAANGLVGIGQPFGVVAVLFLLYFITMIFTELLSNSATAALAIPIGLEIAKTLQMDYMGIAVLIAIAASAGFVTPIGYQTNLMVYGPGGYKFKDYLKVGTPLGILVMIVTVFIVKMVWF